MTAKITMNYKGESATVTLSWAKTPFKCTAKYGGSPRVLGAYAHELKVLGGYFIRERSRNNAEAHLNALYSAKSFFKGFTYKVEPPIDLAKHLPPEDKDPTKIY